LLSQLLQLQALSHWFLSTNPGGRLCRQRIALSGHKSLAIWRRTPAAHVIREIMQAGTHPFI